MSMRRVTFGALLLAVAATGCGGTDEVARDEPTATGTAPQDAPPDDGFAPSDYDVTVSTSCFCAYGGVPVRISVRGDTVTAAVFARGGGRGGAVRGEEAPEELALSIEEVLERAAEAREEGADEVRVRWPEDSDHPTEIWIDRDQRMSDEEIGWTVTDLVVLG